MLCTLHINEEENLYILHVHERENVHTRARIGKRQRQIMCVSLNPKPKCVRIN